MAEQHTDRLTPDRLKQVPGLSALDDATVQQMRTRGRVVPIPEGWTPIHEGTTADEAYLILEGALRVVSQDRTLAELAPGDLIDEMGLVDHTLRSARVTTVQPVLTLAWPRADFQRLRQDHPDFDELVTCLARQRRGENQDRRTTRRPDELPGSTPG